MIMRTVLKICAIVCGLILSHAAHADEAASTGPQTIIQSQIQAFRAGEDAKAYSYAAPSISSFFPTVESFMAMVKGGYSPVWRPQDFQFGAEKQMGDGLILQEVNIIAEDGSAWTALYSLIKQNDGSWKINGVQLLKADGASI
jgi:hypothetical protein